MLNFGLNIIFDSSIKLPITKFEKGQVFIQLFLSTTTKSIKDLDKEIFIKKMKDYKKNNDNSVMSRIVKVLSVNDIKEIAEIIYD